MWRTPHTNARVRITHHISDSYYSVLDAEVLYDSSPSLYQSISHDEAAAAYAAAEDIVASRPLVAAARSGEDNVSRLEVPISVMDERPRADTIGKGPLKRDVIDMSFKKLGKDRCNNALLPMVFDGGCQVSMCSVSWYTSDPMTDWTNYCNLHSLYCGHNEGCYIIQGGEFEFREEGLGSSCLIGRTESYERKCSSDSDRPRNSKPGDPLTNPMAPQGERRNTSEFGATTKGEVGAAHHVPGSDPLMDDLLPAARPVTNQPGYGLNHPSNNANPEVFGPAPGAVGGEAIASKGNVQEHGPQILAPYERPQTALPDGYRPRPNELLSANESSGSQTAAAQGAARSGGGGAAAGGASGFGDSSTAQVDPTLYDPSSLQR